MAPAPQQWQHADPYFTQQIILANHAPYSKSENVFKSPESDISSPISSIALHQRKVSSDAILKDIIATIKLTMLQNK